MFSSSLFPPPPATPFYSVLHILRFPIVVINVVNFCVLVYWKHKAYLWVHRDCLEFQVRTRLWLFNSELIDYWDTWNQTECLCHCEIRPGMEGYDLNVLWSSVNLKGRWSGNGWYWFLTWQNVELLRQWDFEHACEELSRSGELMLEGHLHCGLNGLGSWTE